MTGRRVFEPAPPHRCAIREGGTAYWPPGEDGVYHHANPGAVWQCDKCGSFYRVREHYWFRHYPGPFKRRKYLKLTGGQ